MSALKSMLWELKTKADTSGIEKADKAIDEVEGKADKVDDKLAKMGKSFQTAGSKMGKFGSGMTKRVTVPVAAATTAGVKMSMDLQDSINKVTTLADKDILPVDKIQQEVRQISDASGIAQNEVAEATYSALSAGVESAEVMDFVRSSIDLTRAGFTDMDTAVDATTTVMNAYGDAAYDVGKIHDIFVQTQDKGKISVDELGKNIGRVVPTASTLGVNMDQLGASYAILTAKGQNAQLATTNLNAMLGEMGKSGSKVDEILRNKTGKSFQQLTEDGKNIGEILGIVDEEASKSGKSLADMFGSTSAAAAANTLLSDGVDGFTSSLNDMNDATGKTAENAETMQGDAFKVQEAFNKVKNALMDFGGAIAPYVGQAAEVVSDLVTKFNELDDGTKDTIMKMVGVGAAIGPVASIAGKATGGIGKLMGAFSEDGGITKFLGVMGKVGGVLGKAGGAIVSLGGKLLPALLNPWTLLAGGIAIGAVAIYRNWDTIKEKASELGSNLKSKFSEMGDRWDDFKSRTAEKVKAQAEADKEKFTSTVADMKQDWGDLKSRVSERVQARVDMVKSAFDSGRAAVSSGWSTLKGNLSGVAKGTVDMVKSGFDSGRSAVQSAWGGLKGFLSAQLDSKVGMIKSSFDSGVSAVRDAWEKLRGFLANPIKGTVSLVQKGANKVKGWVSGSHKTGLSKVPYDGYIAELHKGEEVLTATDPRNVNNSSSYNTSNTSTTTTNAPSINININGADNPKAVASEVRQEIDNYFRNMGIVMG